MKIRIAFTPNIFIISLVIFAVEILPSCTFSSSSSLFDKAVEPSGVITEKIINPESEFNTLSVSYNFKYYYNNTAGSQRITMRGSDNILKLIEVKVSNGTLEFRFPEGTYIKGKNDVEIVIYGDKVNNFSAVSGSSLIVDSELVTDKKINIQAFSGADIYFNESIVAEGGINVECYSAGDLKLPLLKGSDVTMRAYSGGDIEIQESNVNSFRLEAYSAGKILIKNTHCKKIDAEAYSAGDIDIIGTKVGKIYAEAYSAGSIKIKGEGTIVKKEKYSGGKVSIN